MISGFSWKWISKIKEREFEPDVVIDNIPFFWNRVTKDWVNSTTSMTEMGCIHTTQGYDLNYTGIIFGSDITYNKNLEVIEVNKENYHDRKGKENITSGELHNYIINIYKTIMYRGIRGSYIYCHDKNLEEYFRNYISYRS